MKTTNALRIRLFSHWPLHLRRTNCRTAKSASKPVPAAQSKSSVTPVTTYDRSKHRDCLTSILKHPNASCCQWHGVFLQVDHELRSSMALYAFVAARVKSPR